MFACYPSPFQCKKRRTIIAKCVCVSVCVHACMRVSACVCVFGGGGGVCVCVGGWVGGGGYH